VLPDGSSVSWNYPGTVVEIGVHAELEILGAIPSMTGSVCTDHEQVCLLGFDDDESTIAGRSIRVVDLGQGRMSVMRRVRFQRPVGIVDGRITDIARPDLGKGVLHSAPDSAILRFQSMDGADVQTIEVSGVTDETRVRIENGKVWLGNPGASMLMMAMPGMSSAREMPVRLDCRPWMPRPELPEGFDSVRFEQNRLEQLRGAFNLAMPRQRAGRPFIQGIEFEDVEIRGQFPAREIVAVFHLRDCPQPRFGRRWPLYDELGNPIYDLYAPVSLKEDIVSPTPGFPPASSTSPGEDGIVWM
jgi:hypothetical protein